MRKIKVHIDQGVTPYISDSVANVSPKATANIAKSKTLQQYFEEERERIDSSSIANHRSRYEIREEASGQTNRIRLHVYDLMVDSAVVPIFGVDLPVGQIFNALNSGLHSLGTGAYHVGIEVNGVEYAYGANGYEGVTGVFTCEPMAAQGFQYKTTIEFADRKPRRTSSAGKSSPQDGREILQQMAREYMGKDYHLLRKNCCTFAQDACLRLGIQDQEIPTWFRNLAEAGAVTQDAATSFIAMFEPSDENLATRR